MKNLLFISPNPVWGGAATANISIAKMLQDEGIHVIYNDEYYSDDSYRGFPVSHYRIHGKDMNANKRLLALVEELNIDSIIWGNTLVFYNYIPAMWRLKKKGVNQIALFHSLSLSNNMVGKVFEQISNFCISFMNHIVYVSAFTEKSWYKYSGFRKHPEKGIVIHNPMEYVGPKHTCANGKLRVGFVGRFSNEKQPEFFCRLSFDTSYEYIAFGDGPLLDEMKSKYPNVLYMGNCMDTDAIYKDIDILVMTSKFENCPMVVLESKARGIPCVVPNVGGISEIVEQGKDGILFDGYSSETILSAINEIKNNYIQYSDACLGNAKKWHRTSLFSKWNSII